MLSCGYKYQQILPSHYDLSICFDTISKMLSNVSLKSRENEGTERAAAGPECPRKLFLDERKSLF